MGKKGDKKKSVKAQRAVFHGIVKFMRLILSFLISFTIWIEFLFALLPGFVSYMAGYVLSENSDITVILGLWLLPACIGSLVLAVLFVWITIKLWGKIRSVEYLLMKKYDEKREKAAKESEAKEDK